MLSDEVLDKVIDRVTRRIEKLNTDVLEQIGKSIAKIGKLTPSKAQQLGQLMKYGGDYDKIVKEISKITNLNVKDIEKIFEEVAKSDYQFAKQFYDYRGRKFIPYKDNLALQQQVQAMARQTMGTYMNLSNTLAFAQRKNGRIVHTSLSQAYQDTIDKAILGVSQGKSTFQEEMYSVVKELASSGLKTINYASGRSVRLDSAIRMNLKDGLRALHNQVQEIVGEEFDSDGVEISVHLNPAEDHEQVQGRQFSNEEYAKLNDGLEAKDYKGKIYTLDHDHKNGYRPISTMNCYHYIFSIVLGVSEPEYTDKQLKQIIDDNNKGFDLDGKHYSMYQGTQLQRNIELELRKAKDTQIMAKASGNMELVQESQLKITQLTNKYRELNEASGLPSKLDRARVPGYRRIKVETPKINIVDKLSTYNVKLDKSLFDENIDNTLTNRTFTQVDNLINKYPILKDTIKENGLSIEIEDDFYAGTTDKKGDRIILSKKYYENKEKFIATIKEGQDDNWSAKISEKDYDIYTITHETGHVLEDAIMRNRIKNKEGFDINELEFDSDIGRYQRQEDVDIFNEIFLPVSEKTGISLNELNAKYISDYGKSGYWFEWFAELFTKMELGEQDIMTKRLKEYLEGELWKK